MFIRVYGVTFKLNSKLCNFITYWDLMKTRHNFVKDSFFIKLTKKYYKNRSKVWVSGLLWKCFFMYIRHALINLPHQWCQRNATNLPTGEVKGFCDSEKFISQEKLLISVWYKKMHSLHLKGRENAGQINPEYGHFFFSINKILYYVSPDCWLI